jgi:hypothetical protein
MIGKMENCIDLMRLEFWGQHGTTWNCDCLRWSFGLLYLRRVRRGIHWLLHHIWNVYLEVHTPKHGKIRKGLGIRRHPVTFETSLKPFVQYMYTYNYIHIYIYICVRVYIEIYICSQWFSRH